MTPLKTLKTLAGSLALAGMLGMGPALAQEVEVDSLSIGIGVDLPFLVHVVAHEKGWFAEAGFDTVEFKTFAAGNLAGEALLADEIQLWTPGSLPPIAMVHNGMPIVVLGTNAVSHGLEKLVVRNDADVETPEDLYDIRLGLLVSSTSGAMLDNIARAYDLDAGRLQAVNLQPAEAMAALGNNEVQGIIFWEPFPYQALSDYDTRLVHTGTVSHFAQNQGEAVQVSNNRTVWVASQDWVRRNPNATRALVDVLTRTQDYVSDPANRAEVIEIFSRFQGQDVAMNDALLGDYTFNPAIDQSYLEDMEAITDFLESTNRIGNRMEVMSYTYSAPLAEADGALVSIEGGWQP